MLLNTSCAVPSLKGGMPAMNSNKHTPNAHQSTAAPAVQKQHIRRGAVLGKQSDNRNVKKYTILNVTCHTNMQPHFKCHHNYGT
jgi:hypothetical protein